MSEVDEMSAASRGSVAIGGAQYKGRDECDCPWYRCPKCGEDSMTDTFRYCPDCGVKLEWRAHKTPDA